jgi:hypothetical protein
MAIFAREHATVRVRTASGLVGEASCLTRNAPIAATVDRLVAPAVAGGDAEDVTGLRGRALRANVMVARTGFALRAPGLVDVALWDIAAQRGSAAPPPAGRGRTAPGDDRRRLPGRRTLGRGARGRGRRLRRAIA